MLLIPCFGLLLCYKLAWIDILDQIALVSCRGKEPASGRVPQASGPDVCWLSHVCCCGKQAGQVAHNVCWLSHVCCCGEQAGQVAHNVCWLSHVCCCGEQAGQVAHNALGWIQKLELKVKGGCKQRQEQQSAARAWHHEWRNFSGAAPSFSLPLWSNPLPRTSSILKRKSNTP